MQDDDIGDGLRLECCCAFQKVLWVMYNVCCTLSKKIISCIFFLVRSFNFRFDGLVSSPRHWQRQSWQGQEQCLSEWANFSSLEGLRRKSWKGRGRKNLRRQLKLSKPPNSSWRSFLAGRSWLNMWGWLLEYEFPGLFCERNTIGAS